MTIRATGLEPAMNAQYVHTLEAILEGVPWTKKSAKAAGFSSALPARTRDLGIAHAFDDEDEAGFGWNELERHFDRAVADLSERWGEPGFNGTGCQSGFEFFDRPWWLEVERLAWWKKGDRFAYIALELGDNTRFRSLSVGERTSEELQQSQ